MADPWTTEWKLEKLAELNYEWSSCDKCPVLANCRSQVVMGCGNPNADIFILGEHPGEDEDESGETFSGPAGECLNSLLDSLEISREDVWLDNLLACKTPENRPALKEEKEHCKDRVYKTIYLVDPMIIVAAGGEAIQFLLGARGKSVEAVLGDILRTHIPGRHMMIEYDVTGIYNPAFILRSDTPLADGSYGDKSNAMKMYKKFKDIVTAVLSLRNEYDEYSERF